MGIYFIAAGTSSRNREKTLDAVHHTPDLARFLESRDAARLRSFFDDEEPVYLWGANREGHLPRLSAGDYVVDVKNKGVVQVFRFSFFILTKDNRLQEYVEWDREKPREKRRHYRYVYFLSSPIRTRRSDKIYFQRAFRQDDNQNWLVGQRYFDDSEVADALHRTKCQNVEDFLGIVGDNSVTRRLIKERHTLQSIRAEEAAEREPTQSEESIEAPAWLNPILENVEILKKDSGHQERDHEDLIAGFFEILGYKRIEEIKFRRGRIDILICKEDRPLITIEVKADWNLSSANRDYVSQAFNYAHEVGTRYVIVTNGDRYLVYDRDQGRTYDEHLVMNFQLTSLQGEALHSIETLRKGSLN